MSESQMDTEELDTGEGPGMREVTQLAIVLGILIGAVMGMANVYPGLFAGMTVSASIPRRGDLDGPVARAARARLAAGEQHRPDVRLRR